MTTRNDRSTLDVGEAHPSAHSAYDYVRQELYKNPLLIEALASCAIENNRLGEVCCGTINRIKNGEPVSDRYILGLAWAIRTLNNK